MKYSSGVWVKSKQGELPGYRSSVSIVEPLKLGVFTSALVSEVAEKSVWTVPAMDILVPAVQRAAWMLAPGPSLPSGHSEMVGDYAFGTRVWAQGGGLRFVASSGVVLNLTSMEGVDPSAALRGHLVNSTEGCRWLDDGPDLEIVYFDWVGGTVLRVRFMGTAFDKLR
eukprot:TRINITY_DN31759_c0_g1_i1.p1 TRINITY_DN31759_c0_g1~~TRINITY_DN31759_c0_g1_i1.p1  ORF type:complete len:168 (-),score=14.16 TRINITY_DN31759_c0_g1_i1:117-620(-)